MLSLHCHRNGRSPRHWMSHRLHALLHILKITSYPSFLCNGYFPINSVFHKIVFHQDPIVPGKVQLVIHNNRSTPVIAARLFLIAVFPLQFAGTCIQTIKGSLCAVMDTSAVPAYTYPLYTVTYESDCPPKASLTHKVALCLYLHTASFHRTVGSTKYFLSAHIAHRVHCCRKCHLTFYISVKIKFI